MRDVLKKVWLVTLFGCFCLMPALLLAADEVVEKYDHQLLVNSQPQDWEHRIDLPESMMAKGMIFTRRKLALLGKLVIVKEEFAATYYYVKVRLPKHFSEPARGMLTVTLQLGEKPVDAALLPAPTELKLMEGGASRKPIFIWKADGRFAALTLYDVTLDRTIWERVVLNYKGKEYDEGFLPIGHHFKWAVKQSDETGRWSKETMAGFRIVEKDGIVIAIPE
jgi:hypothetical protein